MFAFLSPSLFSHSALPDRCIVGNEGKREKEKFVHFFRSRWRRSILLDIGAEELIIDEYSVDTNEQFGIDAAVRKDIRVQG